MSEFVSTIEEGLEEEQELEMEKRILEILNNSFLGQYLEDEHITDIQYDGTALWIQHNLKPRYRAEEQPTIEEVNRVTKQIADVMAKQLNHSNPILDTELGMLRVNVIHELASPDGRSFSIRVSRPRLVVESLDETTRNKDSNVSALVETLVRGETNLLIAGRTGSGKTEYQKVLVKYMNDNDVIVLIEDTRDSHIKKLYPEKNIFSWQSITGADDQVQVTTQDLVRAGLRNNPDWMIIAETRGKDAADMLDVAKSDHNIGTTIHAKGAANILTRLIPMIRQSEGYASMDETSIGKDLTDLFKVGFYLQQGLDENGNVTRYVKEIAEYYDYVEGKGMVGNYLYRDYSEYDPNTGSYVESIEKNRVSKVLAGRLKDARVYHLLPDEFKLIEDLTGEAKKKAIEEEKRKSNKKK